MLALAATFFVATLCLGWRLYTRPRVVLGMEAKPPSASTATVPPVATRTLIKCNARRFIFDHDGVRQQMEIHPYCHNHPLEDLTEDWAKEEWTASHPDEVWTLIEVSDHVHFLKVGA